MKIIARPLDWIGHPESDLHRAVTPLGVYDVSGMVTPCLWRFAPHDGGDWTGGQGEDVAAAKAGAQAHLESALADMIERVEP